MLGVFLVAVMLNTFACILCDQTYTACTIRIRNLALYKILKEPAYLVRASDAERLARGRVHWLQPIVFVAANLMWNYLLLKSFSRP